jgi:D-alanyl-D-alanine carboxypeptidase/D-alanyl-D-alanine-endopeptidase (penicillin-binding protein 4)
MVRRSGGGVDRRSRAGATVLLGAGVVGMVAVLATVLVLRSSTSPADARADADVEAVAAAVASSAASSTTASTRAATTTTTVPVCDRRRDLDAGTVEPPPEWASRVAAAASDPSWGDVERSISVWVEGYGEVVAVAPDLALLPASNEKVLTALGARLVLDPSARFRTEVRTTGDRLVLVADGDPTLRTHGAHSLAALAGQVRAAGIVQVGGVLVDATRFEPAITARGWQDWHIPTYVGPMSALVVDDNRGRADAGYLADPALGNGEAFAAALRAAGVRVGGEVAHGIAGRDGSVVAALESATVAELTHTMLLRSDNEIAESLVREVGGGRTEVGMDRIAAALEPWCLHLVGEGADGSGLSRDDRRSAREWRRLLQVALEQPWAEEVWSGLPVAGRSGTLAGRLRGPATLGIVRAKTGTIIGGSALSGYATLPDGRQVVFSIVVNGEPGAANRAIAAIDRLVAAVVAG